MKGKAGGTNQQWIITGEPSNSAAPNLSLAQRQHLNHSVITSCHSPQWKHWDRKMEDSSGRQAEMDIYAYNQLPTCFYAPLNMCQLCCSVCTFQQFLTSHGPRKQRGSYFLGFYVRLRSDCGVIPQNRQVTALQKGHFRAQHAFIPLPSQKK